MPFHFIFLSVEGLMSSNDLQLVSIVEIFLIDIVIVMIEINFIKDVKKYMIILENNLER